MSSMLGLRTSHRCYVIYGSPLSLSLRKQLIMISKFPCAKRRLNEFSSNTVELEHEYYFSLSSTLQKRIAYSSHSCNPPRDWTFAFI